MQVSHVHDRVTHAVIGGGETIDFGISSSAEFFNILSSTLYSDQILAVVREVLCNAWDAHIEAGCKDRPVDVRLTVDSFTVKDFGKGIHHDDIGPIYGTYGNSTKKNDGNQTGGFGLGCKAPFAYTEHFEVISCNAGVKTIYNMSKSSAQAMGKPGITTIAQFPSEETGLTVSIRLKPQDVNRFREVVRRIIHDGDMNATVNGDAVPTINFDTATTNYLILQRNGITDLSTRILVRYGNVIYPVPKDKQIDKNTYAIERHLEKLEPGHYKPYYIIFQAPPHSIAVTPSRESLSMQDHTVKTLNNLFDGFLNGLDEFNKQVEIQSRQCIKDAVARKDVKRLLLGEAKLPFDGESAELSGHLTDWTRQAMKYLQHCYPGGWNFIKKDIEQRLTLLAADKLVDRGMVQTYLRELSSKDIKGYMDTRFWFQRRVAGPLMGDLCKAGLNPNSLFVDDHNKNYHVKYKTNYHPLRSFQPGDFFSLLPYFHKVVVLSTSQKKVDTHAGAHEAMLKLGKQRGYFIYIASMKKGHVEAAREFFTKRGMRLVDLTIKEEVERIAPNTSTKLAAARKPTRKGIPLLKNIAGNPSSYIDVQRCMEGSAELTQKPEFIIKTSGRKEYAGNLFNMDKEETRAMVELFGDTSAVVFTSSQEEAWIKKGVPNLQSYLPIKVIDYLKNNSRVLEYWQHDLEKVEEILSRKRHSERPPNSDFFIQKVYETPILRDHFGLKNNLTKEDKQYLVLWDHIVEYKHRFAEHKDLIEEFSTTANGIKLHRNNGLFLRRVLANDLLQVLDFSTISRRLERVSPTHPRAKRIMALLTHVLHG